MWILVLMFLLAVPAWAEDLGELSANPARLSGSFGFFDSPARFADPPNQTDQINQTNEIDQFRLSVLTGLDQESFRRRESLQPQQSHKSIRPWPPN
jgi:hypothetical protein